ncbi:ABC transporter substrate-binding protein [Halorubrum lipolyticum]|uniref:Thiamine pyrimidine synthase n=1 Tax=Halorubrum lipolyticum DSM 21995 TaxID=1227482 RepID=M0NP72_9EURY|nr:ABC transporter substrate-binding protein [Halorubrum lipolyticum]EMA59757.1 NMT1/THI5 like domain-containing protein [Halorubrum lipolyticum DSM 21995]
MDTVEHWVLDDDDRVLVERLAAGLGRDAARVLAYLLLRRDHERIDRSRATSMAIRIGTGLNGKAVDDAVSKLEARDLIERAVVESSGGGRPPNAWRPARDHRETLDRVYHTHSIALLERAAAVADADREPAAGAEPLNEPGDESAPERRAEVVVALNWRPNALHLPLYAAVDEGAYERRGLDVSVTNHRGSHQALEAVLDGSADVGLVGAGSVVRALAADRPVVPLAVLHQRTATVLYAIRDRFGEPFESVNQLRGRRILTTTGSETCLLARLFLSQTDLLSEVELVDADGEERDALIAGDADVATGSFADPLELETDGRTVDVLSIGDHFPIYGLTLVGSAAAFERGGEPWRRFLAGTASGWATARTDPVSGAAAVAAETDEPAGAVSERFARAVESFGARDVVRDEGWGWHGPARWDRMEAALEQGDLLGEAP